MAKKVICLENAHKMMEVVVWVKGILIKQIMIKQEMLDGMIIIKNSATSQPK